MQPSECKEGRSYNKRLLLGICHHHSGGSLAQGAFPERLALMGIFTPWKLVDATNQGSSSSSQNPSSKKACR